MLTFYLCSCPVISATEIHSWQTTSDPATGAVIDLLKELVPFSSEGTIKSTSISTDYEYLININSKKQNILGYGAGLPQASAFVLNNLKSRDGSLYNSVLQNLFGNSDDGAAINILRFPIGSCDFSMTNTSYDEHNNDYNLEYFTIDDDSMLIVSVLQDILAVNPNMVLIGKRYFIIPLVNLMHPTFSNFSKYKIRSHHPTHCVYLIFIK